MDFKLELKEDLQKNQLVFSIELSLILFVLIPMHISELVKIMEIKEMYWRIHMGQILKNYW